MERLGIYILLGAVFIGFVWASEEKSGFECYVCNKDPHEDDSQPCIERVESCAPNVTSCSSVAFKDADGTLRTRKFCTSPGIPIYQYLMLFPGSSLCQNIEAPQGLPPPTPITITGPNGKKISVAPPSPPPAESSTLLCVCTKPKCNKGSYKDVLERTMLKNVDSKSTMIDEDAKKKSRVDDNDQKRRSADSDRNVIRFF